MENGDLIHAWNEETQEVLKDHTLPRAQIEAFLKPKVSWATFSLNSSILVYMVIQVAAVVLIGFDLYGYRSNPAMLQALIPMLIACSAFFGYGVFLLSYIRQTHHGDFDLVTAISRKLKVYRRHYEVWMWMGAVSALCLMFALTTLVDNDQGTYRINRPVFFAVMCVLIVLFIYGAQKIAQLTAVKQVRIYLADLQNDALDGSRRLEEARRRNLLFNLILVVILTALLIWGIIRAVST